MWMKTMNEATETNEATVTVEAVLMVIRKYCYCSIEGLGDDSIEALRRFNGQKVAITIRAAQE